MSLFPNSELCIGNSTYELPPVNSTKPVHVTSISETPGCPKK